MKTTSLVFLVILASFGSAFIIRNNRKQTSDVGARLQALDSDAAVKEVAAAAEKSKGGRVAVLLCPAQFCVPADYESFFERLRNLPLDGKTIGTCRVAPLPRTEWIKVARQLPTKEFLEAKLSVEKTLDWYFDAVENALAEIYAEEGCDVNICMIGHSIGGWVARAYLGGISGCSSAVTNLTRERCSSFITIGTPHTSPETAFVDQTRGLLAAIARAEGCSSQALADRGIDVTCVGSSGLNGKFMTTNIEEIVAATSYLPLLGRLGSRGDGIVPTDLAFMESPARRVEIDNCTLTGVAVRHAHVLPTPWNLWDGCAPSIALPEEDFAWYGSDGVLSEWAKYIR
jgi:hypothetical protein